MSQDVGAMVSSAELWPVAVPRVARRAAAWPGSRGRGCGGGQNVTWRNGRKDRVGKELDVIRHFSNSFPWFCVVTLAFLVMKSA